MRQTISGLVAAFAVVAASSVPAMACGGLFTSCAPCNPCVQQQVYVQPEAYVAPVRPVYSGCYSCGAAYERLPDSVEQYHVAPAPQQYYYADQGPTYTGPGNFAPHAVYRESSGYGYGYGYHHHVHHWHGYRHGYAPRYSYAPHHYGHHEYPLRRYY